MKLLLLVEGILILTLAVQGYRVVHTASAASDFDARACTRMLRTDLSGRILSSVDLAGRYCSPRRKAAGGGPLMLTRLSPGGRAAYRFEESPPRTARISPSESGVLFQLPAVVGGLTAMVPKSDRNRVYLLALGQPRRQIYEAEASTLPVDWSEDGRMLAITVKAAAGSALRVIRTDGRLSMAIADSNVNALEARFSWDGEWIAFTAEQHGVEEVWVARLDGRSKPRRVSSSGGHSPEWSSKPKELLYLTPRQELAAVRDIGDTGSRQERLFGFESLASNGFEYQFGGYCSDIHGGLTVLLHKVRVSGAND